ncbi:MAG: hypothetical protein P1P88_10490 [Bacteroidales bacterium]|nr:hypothetical protein [Bacteroidales bacterium]
MESYKKAFQIAKDWILDNKGKNYFLYEEATEEMKNGWLFYYFASNKKNSYSNYPLFIDKHNARVVLINSFFKESMIEEYEKSQGYK